MTETFRPGKIKAKYLDRPKLTEEEKEIARIKRDAGRKDAYEKRKKPRKNLYIVKLPVIDHFIEQSLDGQKRFKGRDLNDMTRLELMAALKYMIQIVDVLCERHKGELLELIGIEVEEIKL